MALLKFGGGITEIRGSMAGNVYSRNRYGAYMRSRTVPTNPNTARQQKVRTSLTELTSRWSQTLTAGQRTAWNLYGANVVMQNKLGENINLSGFNHYLRSNVVLLQCNIAPVDDGPIVFEIPEADPAFAITASEATQQISYAFDNTIDWADEDGAYFYVTQGQPQNAQRNFFAGPWRYMDITAGVNGAPPASPVAAGVEFAIAEGQHIWCAARILRADGRISKPFRADVLVAA